MPLEAKPLDDLSAEEIFEEARLRIPRYAPEWTDFNESDPGMALVQLFAWLTEMTHYRLNRVPERSYIKFLQLLNLELRPAQPATAHLTFTATPGGQVTPLARGTRVEAQPADGGDPLIFETENGLSLVRLALGQVRVVDGASPQSYTDENGTAGQAYPPLGWTAQPGNALYLGFEVPDTELPERVFPQEIRLRVFLPVTQQTGLPQSCKEVESPPPAPVSLTWEYRPSATNNRWRRLSFHDETAAFTREGYMLISGPADAVATPEAGLAGEYFWLRCRLERGSYPTGPPLIDFIRPNTVLATNLTTERDEVLGISDGHPDQVYRLRFTPVQADTLQIVSEDDDGEGEAWSRVDDLLQASAEQRHYTLNATRGEITFGNGRNGQIPVAGRQIVARIYRHGGGEAGNVPAHQITGLVNPPFGIDSVTNERPAVGGRNEQSEEDLKRRAPGQIRSRERAVTAEDFAALAAEAGGVARATAIPLAHPDHPGVEVPGAVTVVIVPDSDDLPPVPSSDQIRSVCRRLSRHRLLTTEVHVRGPRYTAIRVEATVQANPVAAFDAVEKAVIDEINGVLTPLAPSSNGTAETAKRAWQFGQDFYPTGLYSTILKLDHVVAVDFLDVYVNGVRIEESELRNPVRIGPDGLIYGVEDHIITVVSQRDL